MKKIPIELVSEASSIIFELAQAEKKKGVGRTTTPSTQKLAYKHEETYADKDTSAFCFYMLSMH